MHTDMLVHDHLTELIAHREGVEEAMARYLAAVDQGDATGQEKTAAHRLFDVLLASFEGKARPAADDDGAIRRHAGRFGDGLSPILKDVLGDDLPDSFVARCVDRYWAGLRAAAD